ncbi:DnaA regulatory inactivator Hda [Granulosicoccaceae sp. 1_MG-2023]|nr:DnaA regulatory inactivator Hda [Granulosicoccaceae sp. 1_MG-2023]
MTYLQQQIPLRLGATDDMTFDTFHEGAVSLAVDSCYRLAGAEGDEQQLFLAGPSGSGKTHLLTASCTRASSLGQRIAYVPAGSIRQRDDLHGLEMMDLVCIDDVGTLGNEAQIAVFSLINDARQQGCRLLFAGADTPAHLGLGLPDLVSRFTWGPVYQLARLSDEEVRRALVLRAAALGLDISPEVAEFLFLRQPRDLSVLSGSLNRLLQAAAVDKRRLTIPFVKSVLGL